MSTEQYFIVSREHLPTEQYHRLKEQIDKVWPKDKPRPLLLEGVEVIKL